MIHLLSKRKVLSVVIVLAIASQAACGGSLLASLRAALAASTPLVNSLVAAGAINQTQASKIITDFNDGAQCAETLRAAFAAIPSDAPDKKSRKLNASVNAMRCFRVIIDRQNFAINPRVQTAANIADGLFASLVVFYSDSGEMRASAERGPSRTVSASDEKDLERKLKVEVERLKAAMKGQ